MSPSGGWTVSPTPPTFLGAKSSSTNSKPATGRHRHPADHRRPAAQLTTFQLALAACVICPRSPAGRHYFKAFSKLTANEVPLSDDANDVFKIWPTNADRGEFRLRPHRRLAGESPYRLRAQENR